MTAAGRLGKDIARWQYAHGVEMEQAAFVALAKLVVGHQEGRSSQVCRVCEGFPVFDDEAACPKCGTPPFSTEV